MVGISFIFLLATFYKFKAIPEILVPAGNGQRYFYIPYVMLTWTLIMLLGKQQKLKNTGITILLALILISSLSSGFHNPPFIDYNWKLYSQSIGEKDVQIPINPQGWKLTLQASEKK